VEKLASFMSYDEESDQRIPSNSGNHKKVHCSDFRKVEFQELLPCQGA